MTFIVGFFSASAHAADSRAIFGAHPGYVFDVQNEKNKRDIEMVLLERPADPPPPKNVVFDAKLTKEFQEQYKYRFGQTEAEQVINTGRDEEYSYYNQLSVNIQDYRRYQRQFGEYMARRLTEYHVDKWAKDDPTIRPVYEMKDRLSNLNVKIKRGYNLKWKYSLAGPYMEAKLENPHDIEAKVQAQMSGLISAPDEWIYSCAYPLTKRLTVKGLYRQNDGLYQLVLTRRLTSKMSTSLTGSTDTSRSGPSVQQSLVLVGFTWTD